MVRTLISLHLILLVLSTIPLTFSQITPLSIVDQTCKHTPYYNLCVSTLNADRRSATADVAGLALIMVDAIKAKATRTQGTIGRLLRSKPTLKKPLSSCANAYNIILTVTIPEAYQALPGNPKFAEDGANGCATEANSCEQEFKGRSPLTAMNKDVADTSAVAVGIIRLLL
ncbi:putative Pectinesterase inhibitor [Tripterygium wilfordii]|uniref:Putative Pectinesterase inhibitor n=1 Tax=Tripterygium wilfordii TaxID=458696 RepID=A0A7J7CXP3_TRIWF|nr:cell wall / vacuolar inhibitor of fructosidase 1-like [Tripterygium wilfordii]KAF5738778.1 putative Pectinesterase inhibitor [Tripterygium wilfordii]